MMKRNVVDPAVDAYLKYRTTFYPPKKSCDILQIQTAISFATHPPLFSPVIGKLYYYPTCSDVTIHIIINRHRHLVDIR